MKEKILNMLNWDALEYGQLQYEFGLTYLRAYIPDDLQAIDLLERSKTFWAWWRNHWTLRDAQFIEMVDPRHFTIESLRAQYRCYNDPYSLTQRIYPNGAVLEETYARMIGKINDEICLTK